LRRGEVAFTTWLGHQWQLQHPGTLAGNQAGGFILAPVLPPLGVLFVATQLPLSLSSDGVLAFVATNPNPGWRLAQSGRFVSWSELREVRTRGKKVSINGELLLSAATTSLARHLGSELKRLAAMKPAERATAIVQIAKASLDQKAIKERRAEWQKRARAVRRLANLLVVYIFLIAPLLIWLLGFLLCWLGLLVGLLALTITTATLFARAYRALYPNAHDERFTHTMTIALAPTSAMRAHDALSRPLLELFHPLAVAKAFLSDTDFGEFARRALLDLRHPALPPCPNEMPEAQATERFFRETLLTAAEDFLTRHGVELEALCRAPQPGDESSQAYCPRCEAQFTTAEGRCADCGGLMLVTFKVPKT
jgi:hypothetical protein